MLNLLLMRHAKSSWDNPSLDDFERPLNKRGTGAATAIGARLASTGPAPGLVLCSTAVRTRATLALVLREIDATAPQVIFDDALYLADAETLLARIRETDGRHRTIMVVAHNPGLHTLAVELAGHGRRELLDELAHHFPTAALAHITFRSNDWRAIKPASGELADYVLPRKLG